MRIPVFRSEKRYSSLMKTCALALVVIFLFPYLTWAFETSNYQLLSSDQPQIQHMGKIIALPRHLGTVKQGFQGRGKTVVCIQDLHCNYEVQKNIAGIIRYLAQNHGLRLAGEEGASETVRLDVLREFPVRRISEEVSDYFVRQGKLTGAEHFAAVGREPVRLEGVETPELYSASYQAVRSFLNSESQGYLFDLREMLNGLKPLIYSAPLSEHDRECQAYRDGRLDLLRFAVFLERQAARLGADLREYPQLGRFAARRSPEFAPGVVTEDLYRELDRLDTELRERLYATQAQREFDQLLRRLDGIEKILNISATPEEVAHFRSHRSEFSLQAFADFLQRHAAGPEGYADRDFLALEDYLQKAETFYRLADVRSGRFVDNLLRKMDDAREDLAVMVNGGFHSEGIAEELKRRNISFITVQPSLTRPDTVNPYFSLLQGRKLPVEKLLEKNQSVMAVPSWPGEKGFVETTLLFEGARALAELPGFGVPEQRAVRAFLDKYNLIRWHRLTDGDAAGIRIPDGCAVLSAEDAHTGRTLYLLLAPGDRFVPAVIQARAKVFENLGAWGVAIVEHPSGLNGVLGGLRNRKAFGTRLAKWSENYRRGILKTPWDGTEKPADILKDPAGFLLRHDNSGRWGIFKLGLRAAGLVFIFGALPLCAAAGILWQALAGHWQEMGGVAVALLGGAFLFREQAARFYKQSVKVMHAVFNLNPIAQLQMIRPKPDPTGHGLIITGDHYYARNTKPEEYPDRAKVADSQIAWNSEYEAYAPPDMNPGERLSTTDEMRLKRIGEQQNREFARAPDGRPLNPQGRTGLKGKGPGTGFAFFFWGPNFTIDPVVTRVDPKTGKREVLMWLRKDNDKLALPGSFLQEKQGETESEALDRILRELFAEPGKVDKSQIMSLGQFYIDDWRNTDNCWVETIAWHIEVPYDTSIKTDSEWVNEKTWGLRWASVVQKSDDCHANHHEILKVLHDLMPDQYLANGVNRPLEPHPLAVKHHAKLNHEKNIATYDQFVKDLNVRELREFEQAFFNEFVAAVKAYYESHEWKWYRNVFLKATEQLTGEFGALERNGFYQSRHFIQLVRRFMLSERLTGWNRDKPEPMAWEHNPIENTGPHQSQKYAVMLVKDIAHQVTGKYFKGQIHIKELMPGVLWHWFIRLRTMFLGTTVESTVVHIAIFVGVATVIEKVFHVTEGDFIVIAVLVGIGIIAQRLILQQVAERVEKNMAEREQETYIQVLLHHIFGITPAVEAENRKEYREKFQRIKNIVLELEAANHAGPALRHPVVVRQGSALAVKADLNRKLLDEMERMVLETAWINSKYILIANIGLGLAESGMPVDTRMVICAMLKDLAESYPDAVKQYRSEWAGNPENLMNAAFLEIMPLAEMQIGENYKHRSAEVKAAESVHEDRRQRDYEIELHKMLIRKQYQDFDREYLGYILNSVRQLEDPADRRMVIYSFMLGGGLFRLRHVRYLKEHIGVNREYLEHISYIARTSWPMFMDRIGEDAAAYGMTAEEAARIKTILENARYVPPAERLQKKVLSVMNPKLYQGMNREIDGIVADKNRRENARVDPAKYGARDQRPYQLRFYRIMLANQDKFEGIAGVIHQALHDLHKGKGDVESEGKENRENYQKSCMLDARLFDRKYNPATAAYLIKNLAIWDEFEEEFPEIQIFLGNLLEHGYQPHPTSDQQAQLRLYHLLPVQEYLQHKRSRQSAFEAVKDIYRVGKRLPKSEDLKSQLVNGDGFIEREFQKIDRILELENQYQIQQFNITLSRGPGDIKQNLNAMWALDEEIRQIKKEMTVIVFPLAVPWEYLMEKSRTFGDRENDPKEKERKEQERRSWLVSLQASTVGMLGLLEDKSFFTEIEQDLDGYWRRHETETDQEAFFGAFGNPSQADRIAITKLRRLMRYNEGVWSLDNNQHIRSTYTFDQLAREEHSTLVGTNWHSLLQMLTLLGLDTEERFADVIRVGRDAAEKQDARKHGNGSLSDVIRTTPFSLRGDAGRRGPGSYRRDAAVPKPREARETDGESNRLGRQVDLKNGERYADKNIVARVLDKHRTLLGDRFLEKMGNNVRLDYGRRFAVGYEAEAPEKMLASGDFNEEQFVFVVTVPAVFKKMLRAGEPKTGRLGQAVYRLQEMIVEGMLERRLHAYADQTRRLPELARAQAFGRWLRSAGVFKTPNRETADRIGRMFLRLLPRGTIPPAAAAADSANREAFNRALKTVNTLFKESGIYSKLEVVGTCAGAAVYAPAEASLSFKLRLIGLWRRTGLFVLSDNWERKLLQLRSRDQRTNGSS